MRNKQGSFIFSLSGIAAFYVLKVSIFSHSSPIV